MALPSMVMPAAAPYGLKPVGLVGGRNLTGAIRQMSIASGSGTAIFYGDVVKLINTGTVQLDAGTDAMTPVGVFLGCSYTDPNSNQKVFKQYYPASTVATDIYAYVLDDPQALFRAAVVSSGTTMSGVLQTNIGNNCVLYQTAGSTITGNSANGVGATTATTNTWPLRIVDIVPESQNSAGSYTEVIVKWNFGMHQYDTATGV